MKVSPQYVVIILVLWMITEAESCSKLTHVAQAERYDDKGLRCYDNVKVHMCGGKCESSEISDWEFPFKKSHHPMCVYGTRRLLLVRLRHCDPGVTPGTDVFRYVTAENCRCKISDWEFPFKKSHHPMCVYGTRRLLLVRLRHCDPGVTPGTDVFRYVTAEDCRCKMCSSQKTNCEWLPPDSTLLNDLQRNKNNKD